MCRRGYAETLWDTILKYLNNFVWEKVDITHCSIVCRSTTRLSFLQDRTNTNTLSL